MAISQMQSRRSLLRYLAASPLFAGKLSPQVERAILESDHGQVISSLEEAINVFDFRETARQKLPAAHYGYLATGTLDDATLLANRTGFDRWQLRLRRLIDVERLDPSIELFGRRHRSPIALAPVGNQQAFHPEGALAAARGARPVDALQILSTFANWSVEDVIEARGAPVWFQLYPGSDWNITAAIIRRMERAGCPALVLTVDARGSKQETRQRFAALDDRDCNVCHNRKDPKAFYARRPLFRDIDIAKFGRNSPYSMSWDLVRRIRDATTIKLVLKGIVTREDAEIAVENGVDALVVSNHGGRQDPSGRGTIESLPEVVEGARGRIPVLVDGGFRRGTDIFKALALGATGVCVGRPYVWGLAAFGDSGVEAVIRLLNAEFEMVMRQAGTPSVADITGDFLVQRGH